MSNRTAIVILVLIGLIWLAIDKCTLILPEYEQAVVTEFGDPVGTPRKAAGLYFVMPWYDVHRFPKRLLRWDGERAQIPTKDKRFIWVDAAARWRIAEPLLFYQSVKDFEGAQSRMDDVLDSAVREVISKNNLIEAVRPDARPLELPAAATQVAEEEVLTVQRGREALQREIATIAGKRTKASFGIELIDVRIKRINYIEAVQANVFNRMIAERQKVAEQYRSEGAGAAAQITGTMERRLKEIRSGAYRKAREIEGDAEAQSTRIYAEAYNQDADLYTFLQTLEAYPKILGAGRKQGTKTNLVLGTDSDLLGYLKSATPGQKAAP